MAATSFFRIQNDADGTVVAVPPGASEAAPVVLAEYAEDAPGQLWQLTPDGYVLNPASGFVLDVQKAVAADGTRIIAFLPNDPVSANQLWDLTPQGRLKSRLPGAYVLDAGAGTPGTPLRIWSASPDVTPQQHWTLVRDIPPVAGQRGAAITFDAGAWVTVDSPPIGTGDFTLEAWVRTTTGGPVVATSGGWSEGVVLAVWSDGSLFAGLIGGPYARGQTLYTTQTKPAGLTDGDWHHVAAVRQGTEVTLYVDGAAAAGNGRRLAHPVDVVDQSYLFLGSAPFEVIRKNEDPLRAYDLAPRTFDGSLDQARVWTRARTPREIAEGMHHALSTADPDVWGSWSFDREDVTDDSPWHHDGTVSGTPTFAPSEVELFTPGGPYVDVQAKLIQEWVHQGDGTFSEIRGYRTVVSCFADDGAPLQSWLTLSADDAVTVLLADGTSAPLGAGATYVVRSDVNGRLPFTIDAANSLACQPVKVRTDFMASGEQLVVSPDRHVHTVLAATTPNMLRGLGPDGKPAPSRPAPLPPESPPGVAEALAQAVSHVMSTAVTHTVQGNRPLTRSAAAPVDLADPVPYVARFQHVGLAATGFDAGSDAITAHYLAARQPVVRIVVPENAPAPHWVMGAEGTFATLDGPGVADILDSVSLTYCDQYAQLFQCDGALFRGLRSVELTSSQLVDTAEARLASRSFFSSFRKIVAAAAKVVVATVESTVTDLEQDVKTLAVIAVSHEIDEITKKAKAFTAVIQTVEDAAEVVGGFLEQAAAKVENLLDFIKDLFEWDDVLNCQRVIERMLATSEPVVLGSARAALSGAKGSVADVKNEVDAKLAEWRASLDGGRSRRQAAAVTGSSPPGVRDSYITTMLGHSDTAGGGNDGMTAIFAPLAASSLAADLEKALADVVAAAPDAIESSGLMHVFDHPSSLIDAGVEILLDGLQVLVDLALTGAEQVLEVLLDSLGAILDAVYQAGCAVIDIPLVSAFYKHVVTHGEDLTAFGVLALAAAVPATFAAKLATGAPLFTKAQADAIAGLPSPWSWIPYPSGPGTRSIEDDIGADTVWRLKVAGRFVCAGGVAVWGVAATSSDILSLGLKDFPRSAAVLTKWPTIIAIVGQAVVLAAGASMTPFDFQTHLSRLKFAFWALHVLPLASNIVAAVSPAYAKADPVVTGLFGASWMVFGAAIWAVESESSQEDAAINGVANIVGQFSWISQFAKVPKVPSPQALAAMVVLDAIGYLYVAANTFASAVILCRKGPSKP